MMKKRYAAVGLAMMFGAASAAQTGPGGTATASLHDPSGRVVGRAELRETPNGLLLTLRLQSAPPGVHAFHIHTTGRCEAPDFESAGGHFAPGGRHHGFLAPGGAHGGDLPNVHVPAGGKITVEAIAPGVVLAPAPNSLFDADGAALVLHGGADDYLTEPAGDAGRRIACGVVTRA